MGAMGVDVWKLATGFEPDLGELQDEVVEVEPQPDDNVIGGLDFETLAEQEDDETLKSMDLYFSGTEPTAQNEQTGIFKGKNLIFITAESFTDFAIDPKYTPTLYKLLTEGYNFTNFYNPIWGVSTLDGEYVNLQSLVPKPGVWSMKESAENWLPFTLGNQLSKLGYEAKAYHNHSVYYYDRVSSHPNLGYDFKGQGREYNFENIWPESDLEMIDKTTADFLTAGENGKIEPFHVYYLTVSGHLNYNFYGNVIAYRNRELMHKVEVVSKRTLREKILADLSYRAQAAGGRAFEMPLGRVAWAEYLCADRSALTRELARMRSEGLIDYHRNRFALRWSPDLPPDAPRQRG